MKKTLSIVALVAVALVADASVQASAYTAPPAVIAAAERMLSPEAEITSVEEVVPGIYEVISDWRIFYVTGDGKFLIDGSIWDVEARRSLTEDSQKELRRAALAAVGDDEMVVYHPRKRKYTVNVFTDVDCGYCRKFHAGMPEMQKFGIRVNYLLTPLRGGNTRAKMVGVWCASNRNAAMDRAKQGKKIPLKQCDNPVDKHLRVARQAGMRGTPAIVFESGTLIAGYLPPDKLLKALQDDADSPRS